MSKPVPHPTELSAPYWKSLNEGVLSVQRCTGCGAFRHYPRLVCDNCYSLEFDWVPTSGRGAVHSWTVAHHAFHRGFADEVPYVLAIVELQEGVRALGRLRDVPAGEIRIGLPVQLVVEQREDGLALPAFVPAPPQGSAS